MAVACRSAEGNGPTVTGIFVTEEFAEMFFAAVMRATREAEGKFLTAPNHLSRDLPHKSFWVSVILEEVGKLARTTNKLAITPPGWASSRETWDVEGKRRLMTIASLVLRMAEAWDHLPDEQRGKWRVGMLAQGDPGVPGEAR